ncbi:MAG: hypothetical protein JSV87_04255 [Candidatus Bathyarchaeota archaeon]|nr:MAG: hypothetical protein JSV87_04255 [Candidatus Bathyarchaeota archaeon]
MNELDLEEFRYVLEKAEQHHFSMTRGLLRKLEERDQEIIRLRTLLTEHGVDPTSRTRQMEMNLAEIGKRFKSMEKQLDTIDRSAW